MDYHTRVAEIDNKVSSLDGKTDENKTKNKWINRFNKRYFLGEIQSLMGEMVLKFI